MFNIKSNADRQDRGRSSSRVLLKVSILMIVLIAIIYLCSTSQAFRGAINRFRISGVGISSFHPKGEVERTTNFTVEFTHDMVEKWDVGLDLESTPITFQPEIKGQARWVSINKLCFYPREALKPATKYEAEVLPDIATLKNRFIKGKRKFEFYTPPLKVIHSFASIVNESPDSSTSKIQYDIDFNYMVEPKELGKYINLFYEEKGKRVSLNFVDLAGDPSERLSLFSEPVEKQTRKKSFKIIISKGLTGTEGPLGLMEDFVYSLDFEPDLKVFGVFSQEEQRTRYIRIEFSSPVDSKLAKEHISIDPPMEFTIEPEYHYLNIKGNFKANKWYEVKISKGLAAVNGAVLLKDFAQKVKIGNLSPSIKFQSEGIFLPRKGSRNIAFESINVDTIKIEVEKIYLNNLFYLLQRTYDFEGYDYGYYGSNLGRMVHEEEIKINAEKDATTETAIDVGQFYDKGKKGLYRVSAMDNEEYWTSDSKLVLITDLGIIADMFDDNLYVWVNSLETLSPVSEAEITIFSDNNQVIASGRTNSKGFLEIKDLKARMKDEEYTPYLITVKDDEDLSFLRFNDCMLPTASFDVGGRKLLTSGYEAFLYPDRDIFRPNDTAHIAVIIRGVDVTAPKSFPVKMVILDPMNRNFDEILKTPGDGGIADFEIAVPGYAMTGQYLAKLLIGDEEIGRMEFFVEDFIPTKTKVLFETDKKAYLTGETVNIDITGQYLFGPPAANREIESKLLIKSFPFGPQKWADYSFGDEDKKFDDIELDICQATLDENGKQKCSIAIPKEIYPSSALKGSVSVTLKEYGGRAVSAYKDIDIHPYPFYIGLKPKSSGYADIGKPYDIEFATVNPDGNEIKRESLEVNIYKIIYNTVLKRDDEGNYHYDSERSDELIKTYSIDPRKTNKITYTPDDYGRYKIALSDPESKATSAIMFYASGWGYAPWSMENPGKIDITVEKKEYKAGEKAKLLIKAPFAGKLLLITQREKVLDYEIIDMPKNTATMEIPIKAEYAPNVYVTATVIKSLDKFDGKSPLRAFGIVPVMVDSSSKKLDIEITAPKEIKPGNKLDLNIKVKNKKGVSFITVSAVDEGILQLTDFQTPDPFEFFHGKKRCDAAYYDIFSFILPELDKFKKKPAGDGYEEEIRKKHLSPVGIKRVEPVSLWSGIVKTDSSGNAKINFKVPSFQGRLRVMAVASNESSLGSMEQSVFVRDRIVIDPTLPRFLASKDEFNIPVTIFNGTGKDGKFDISIQVTGPVTIIDKNSAGIEVKKDGENVVIFKGRVGDSIGKASFTIKASGNNEKTQANINVPVRPSSPVITKTGSIAVTEKTPSEINLPTEFIDGTQDVRLIISSLPEIKFARSLQYLLGYPHGCVEQTTSKIFPLLYFDELAKAAEPELFKSNSVWYFVDEGIKKLVAYQWEDGSFSYWPSGYYINDWTSIYASHFLVEARKAGYQIPQSTYDSMISWLENYTKREISNQDNIRKTSLQNQVYACYVLSLAGSPPKSTINYIKDNRISELPVSSQYQIAHCFALLGDKKTALSLLPSEIHPITVERETGGNFNSPTRENAIMLGVLQEIAPNNPGIPVLIKQLTDSIGIGRWGSTQENAFALMALGKALKKTQKADYSGTVLVDGKTFRQFDEKGITIRDITLSGKKPKINIKGTGTCYIYWQAWGVPKNGKIDEYNKGVKVTREFLDVQGSNLEYDKFKQGDLYIAKITAEALDKNLENVIIDDMLPAGFEIENPRLATSAEISWIEKSEYTPNYTDIRDDRIFLFTSLNHKRPVTFYYAVRAVTSGTFNLPPVSAECMYDPTYTSVQSSGKITILE